MKTWDYWDISINKKNTTKNNSLDPHSLHDRLNKKYAYIGKTKFRYLTDNEIDKYNLKKCKVFDTKIMPIIQYSLNGKYIKTYPFVRAATIAFGNEPKNRGIYHCLTRSRRYGFWIYLEI